MDELTRRMPAGEFKAKCLRLLDDVARLRAPLIITKRGIPVAKLVPLDDEPAAREGSLAGTGWTIGDIVGFV